jgi:predicted ATPase
MEKKLTNSDPLREPADKHSIYALLQVVSQLDEATLHRELGRLVEAEIVYQRGVPPQATYTFKHALIQDAAYQSLLRSTR